MIPKIIHQTAPRKSLSPEENRVIKRNQKLLPEWDFRFYDDLDNLEVMWKAFPEYAEHFSKIKRGVVQADIIRCVYLYYYGGWYFDTDYSLLRRLEGEVPTVNDRGKTPEHRELASLSLILPVSGIEGRDQHLVCNSIMASEKEHLFWRDYISHIFECRSLNDLSESMVESVTGPLGLSLFYLQNKRKYPDICLPPKEYFHPKITMYGFSHKKDPVTYGVHWCWGSWRSKSLPRKVKNFVTRKVTSYL
jgi:mannosyltransferase OCH1-like enzyme